MPRLASHPRRVFTAALLTAALCPAASAFEHVTLRNGFEFDCLRHEALDATRIRLYMPGDDNYQDLSASDILRVETLPDPPPAAKPAAAAMLAAPAGEPTSADLHQLLSAAGTAHNIDAALLASVVQAESGGHINAISRTGARGLMQLMPATAREVGVSDSFHPGQNIAGGTAYLDSLLKRYKDNLSLALAAYNAGPGAVDRYHGVPPFRETRAYVARVIREFNRRKQATLTASLGVH